MTDLSRYLSGPAAGGAGDLFAHEQPLGAARAQLYLASNTRLLLRRNACRALVNHPGWSGYTVAPFQPWTSAPTPGVISWNVLGKDGGASACLGTFYLPARYFNTGRWPAVVLTSRGQTRTGGSGAGFLLGISPGRTPHAGITSWSSAYTTSTGMAAITDGSVPPGPPGLVIQLRDGDLAEERFTPGLAAGGTAGESGPLKLFTAWVGAFINGGATADWQGLTLSLIPPVAA